MLGSKELDEKLWSGRFLGTMMFGVAVRRMRLDMRHINKLEDKKVVHDAKLGNIKKTKNDLDHLIKWFQKFEKDSEDSIEGLVKFENYELGKVQTLEEFLETLQKLGFPAGLIEADSHALLLVLEHLKDMFLEMREHFGILHEKAEALIKQFKGRAKSAEGVQTAARSQAKRFEGASRRARRRIGG